MFSPETLSRLSDLNRQRLPGTAALNCRGISQTAEPLRANPALHASASGQGQPVAAVAPGSTTELPTGRELQTDFGAHWLIEQPVALVWPDYAFHWDQYARRRDGASIDRPRHIELEMLLSCLPQSAVFLDLETCGLGGAMTFLVGLIHQQDGQMKLSQLLARNYAEEKAVLGTLWQIMAGQQVLVTFNGKSFDWPLVHDRSTLHHLGRDTRLDQAVGAKRAVAKAVTAEEANAAGTAGPSPGADQSPANGTESPLVRSRHDPRPNPLHCDLLHHARRRWRGRLPNCKLQTLEQYLCGRRRSGDIPGYAIPAAYHEYVRTGDAWQMRSVLHHNALDLVTLLQLAMRCAVTPPSVPA